MSIVKNIRPTFFLRFVVASVLLLSSAALVGAAVEKNNDKDFLRIIYSGNLIGNVQPCG